MKAERPGMIRMLREWFFKSASTKPTDPLPVERRVPSDFTATSRNGARITWLGHSTSIIEIDGVRLLVDPVWAERASPSQLVGPRRFFAPPLPLDDLPPIDAVLISHDHYDHLDKATVRDLGSRGHRFLVPTGVGDRLRGWGVPSEAVTEMAWWDRVALDGVTVSATPARHFSGRSILMTDRNRTSWCGFAINGPTRSVYYAGDTAMFGGFAEIGRVLGPFDATLMEVGAYDRMWPDVHIGPEQAVEAVAAVGGGLMIPVHWGTFDLAMHGWTEPVERLLLAAEARGVAVAIPRPGGFVDLTDPPAVVRWWPELPWNRAETHPIVSPPAVGLEWKAPGQPNTPSPDA